MSQHKIHEASIGYGLVKGFVHFLFPKFYRQIEIRGLNNIPENEPLIFAGNHQNGVMDPIAIILHQNEPIVYMARADIFSNPLFKILLRFIKVTPVYRIRDGYENLSKNDQQIREAIEVLLDRKHLGVMPEGNHGEQHKLRPFVKGLFRIGYQAEIMLENKAHVKIIPVGIDYSFYQHAGSDLVMTYGKPIEVKDFLPGYLENPAIGLNVLRAELATAISELMLDIRSNDYDRTYRLCCLGVPAYLRFQVDKNIPTNATTMAGLRFDARIALAKLFDRLEIEDLDSLNELDALTMNLRKLPGYPSETMEWMEEKPTFVNQFLLGLFSFLLAPGIVLNSPAWALNRLIVHYVEDKQMHTTFAFTLGAMFNLLVYLPATFIFSNILNANFVQSLVLFSCILVLGVVSERARQYLRIPFRKLLFAFGKRKRFVNVCLNDFQILQERIKQLLLRYS